MDTLLPEDSGVRIRASSDIANNFDEKPECAYPGHLTDLSDCSSCLCLRVPRFWADTLLYCGSIVDVLCLTVSQYCFGNVMATGNSRPGADRRGIDFKVHVQIPWNAPEAYVMLDLSV